MSRYSDSDPYIDPTAGVLKNRLNIANETVLAQAEADFVAARSFELSRTPLKGHFDLAHLQAINKHLFGDLYEWAGRLRTIDISKGVNRFAHHAHIEIAAASIFQKLANENHLAGLGFDAFSDRAASATSRTQTATTSLGKTRQQPICWPLRSRRFTATHRSSPGSFAGTSAILNQTDSLRVFSRGSISVHETNWPAAGVLLLSYGFWHRPGN